MNITAVATVAKLVLPFLTKNKKNKIPAPAHVTSVVAKAVHEASENREFSPKRSLVMVAIFISLYVGDQSGLINIEKVQKYLGVAVEITQQVEQLEQSFEE